MWRLFRNDTNKGHTDMSYNIPRIAIPCSKCGDTLRVTPWDLEEGKEIKCPRCDQFFTPSRILIEKVAEIIKSEREKNS